MNEVSNLQRVFLIRCRRKLESYSAELLARAVAEKDGEMIVAAIRVLEELCLREAEDRVPLKAIKNLGTCSALVVELSAHRLSRSH